MNPPTQDINLRSEDALVKPKWPSFVMLSGELFDPTAVSCYGPLRVQSGVAARAGGPSQPADKKAISPSGADGPVIGTREHLSVERTGRIASHRHRWRLRQRCVHPIAVLEEIE
jgi:hypothetical protein